MTPDGSAPARRLASDYSGAGRPMLEPLDNIVWHSLNGAHAPFALGTGAARRYAPGFSPVLGFADPREPDFAAIAEHCEAGEPLYCLDWAGHPPARWQVLLETTLLCLVWAGESAPPDNATEAVPLGRAHAAQALELAGLTRPGPFGPRTPELGEYFGVFDGERLVAMAGERFHAGALREISGVCTLPQYQGRGLARRLMHKLMHRQAQRGELPFLHVLASNTVAFALYRQMGFREHCQRVLRVVARRGA